MARWQLPYLSSCEGSGGEICLIGLMDVHFYIQFFNLDCDLSTFKLDEGICIFEVEDVSGESSGLVFTRYAM